MRSLAIYKFPIVKTPTCQGNGAGGDVCIDACRDYPQVSFAVSEESGGAMKRLSLLIAFAIYEKAKPKITPAK
jgi:hypothetical protein